MKRQRSFSGEQPINKKAKYSSSSESDSGDEIGNHWDQLMGNRWESANLDNMAKRKVKINNSFTHYDTPDGHLKINNGDIIANKYTIERKLGEGTFGKVYQCENLSRNPLFRFSRGIDSDYYYKQVAIKIIRSEKKYRSAAFIEINTILLMHQRQPCLKDNCVIILDWFAIGNHICIVFPLYGQSLLSYIEDIKNVPVSYIRDIAWQILLGLTRLHKQELIHTDLKPENILFTRPLQTISGLGNVVPECTDIRLIDFGNSTFSKSYHSNVIATRHYRPPEVLMNIGWSYPCDIWAVGCILLEMYTGQVIFAPRDDYEHLAMIEKVISPIPSKMGRQARFEAKTYFYPNGYFDYHDADRDTELLDNLKKLRKLKEIVHREHEDFYQLVISLLEIDPEARCTALEALELPFFSRISIYRNQLRRIFDYPPDRLPSIQISSKGTVSRSNK